MSNLTAEKCRQMIAEIDPDLGKDDPTYLAMLIRRVFL